MKPKEAFFDSSEQRSFKTFSPLRLSHDWYHRCCCCFCDHRSSGICFIFYLRRRRSKAGEVKFYYFLIKRWIVLTYHWNKKIIDGEKISVIGLTGRHQKLARICFRPPACAGIFLRNFNSRLRLVFYTLLSYSPNIPLVHYHTIKACCSFSTS
jgi:hypothetical protein